MTGFFRGMAVALGALCFAGAAAAQENLDQGKSPAQLYASDCAICHKSPQGLAKSGGLLGVESFLRSHYTASRESAAAIAKYLEAAGPAAAPGKKPPAKRVGKGDDKAGDKPGDKGKAGDKKDGAVALPGDNRPVDAKPAEPKASESKPVEAKPAEPKAEAKPAEPAESKPAESKPAESPKPN